MPEIKNTKSQLMHQTYEQGELPLLIDDPAVPLNNRGLFFEQNLDLLHSLHLEGFALCKEENLNKPKLHN